MKPPTRQHHLKSVGSRQLRDQNEILSFSGWSCNTTKRPGRHGDRLADC